MPSQWYSSSIITGSIEFNTWLCCCHHWSRVCCQNLYVTQIHVTRSRYSINSCVTTRWCYWVLMLPPPTAHPLPRQDTHMHAHTHTHTQRELFRIYLFSPWDIPAFSCCLIKFPAVRLIRLYLGLVCFNLIHFISISRHNIMCHSLYLSLTHTLLTTEAYTSPNSSTRHGWVYEASKLRLYLHITLHINYSTYNHKFTATKIINIIMFLTVIVTI